MIYEVKTKKNATILPSSVVLKMFIAPRDGVNKTRAKIAKTVAMLLLGPLER